MLGQAVTLTLLLLLKVPQGQECPGSTNRVVGLSGVSLQLWPNTTQTKTDSVEWRMQLTSHSTYQKILKWENGSSTLNNINNKYSFIIENLTLLINAAQQQDSGLYCLEVTNKSGKVWRVQFEVLVFEFRFWPVLVTIVTLIILLLVGTLACFCVWKRKRKQPQTSPEEFLTIYEDVKDPRTQRNQGQKPKQNSPGEGSTIYSTVQSQSSASTSQEIANTLYSLIQPSRKSGSKKRNHSPSFSSTVYEEVGKRQPKAQDPAQLSRKELESFSVYS
uniref:CD244 molecule n=1 Tax=Propithecus coquereli TaxID=379532 RepID=A0A2K6EPA4_PROCO